MINYLTGDATDPQVPGPKIIAHVCNDIGGWGRGFVLSLSKRWPEPEREYRRWYQEGSKMLVGPGFSELTIGIPCQLGEVIFIPVANGEGPPGTGPNRTFVANMVAQRGVMALDGVPPVRYDAIERCLWHVAKVASKEGASVHMPRIGCGLAGGRWSEIEPIVDRTLVQKQVPVYVYDFDTGDARTVPWR